MTPELFQTATGCTPALATAWAGPISSAMLVYGIDTSKRCADFLAQIGHESGGFVYSREIWQPTVAQQGYEGRADLGNTQPGDGHRYLGRCPLMITGRANYRRVGKALGVDLEQFPELLESHELGSQACGLFWRDHNLNKFADADDFLGESIVINGKNKNGLPNGWEDRQRRRTIARAALGVS